ncbi:type II secretion system F family protein [Candidatus Woesearchaeota archaeon]|nr:type II secretion system F family protein [Candidatus Woesearchaeota archaeon]
MSFLADIGKYILPDKIRTNMKRYLQKTGRYDAPYELYGALFLLSISASTICFIMFIYPAFSTSSTVLLIPLTILGIIVLEILVVLVLGIFFWIYYEFIIFRRTTMIEEVLPDFLQEVSINLRAGMSFDKALWNSVEPEFGVLEKEIEIVAKKVMAGDDTEEVLNEFAHKYNSTLLQESMDMVLVGIKSGGNIAELIDKIVENVKEASFLRKELVASVMSYVIFIAVTAVVISPILFALSFNLMQIIQGLGEKLTTAASYGVSFFSPGETNIKPEDFILFSKLSVIIIAAVSSMIIADLREGSIKAGIKYVLIFGPVAYLIYVVSLALFTGIFGVIG